MKLLSKRLAVILGTILAVTLLLGHTARQSAAVPPAAVGDASPPREALTGPADNSEVTVLTLNISNHAPGRLIDALTAQGHGNQTLFQVLGYLKAQTGAAIPDAFYQDVAAAPAGSEVFTARLRAYPNNPEARKAIGSLRISVL
ncbi:MAG: hypothetical protein BWY10_02622 [Chloroflexi bacterium ADurb.Bin180]|nr:MAG: hypothetical protein BWY10_02622 [Chloroflexi bacterium ADurb.Bin180]